MTRTHITNHNLYIQCTSIFPVQHELKTLLFLQNYYQTKIEYLDPSPHQGDKTPDIIMFSLPWEIKSPHGKGKHTLEHCIKAASRQCENIIIDLRRMTGSYRQYIGKIQREFVHNRRLKRLKVITKAQKVLDFTK